MHYIYNTNPELQCNYSYIYIYIYAIEYYESLCVQCVISVHCILVSVHTCTHVHSILARRTSMYL